MYSFKANVAGYMSEVYVQWSTSGGDIYRADFSGLGGRPPERSWNKAFLAGSRPSFVCKTFAGSVFARIR